MRTIIGNAKMENMSIGRIQGIRLIDKPSGKLTVCYWKLQFIVDFPTKKKMCVFHSCLKLPEDTPTKINRWCEDAMVALTGPGNLLQARHFFLLHDQKNVCFFKRLQIYPPVISHSYGKCRNSGFSHE